MDNYTALDKEYLETFYSGSRLLEPYCDTVGLQIDQVCTRCALISCFITLSSFYCCLLPLVQLNFFVTQVLALLFAYVYRKILSYKVLPHQIRLLGTLLPGLALGFFCYGKDLIHLILLGFFSYLATLFTPARDVHKTVLVVALIYLSKLHLYRMIYDYGGYVLDISGPLMIGVQKVTSLGFNLYDGKGRKSNELSPEQARYAVKKNPSLLEYFSYLLTFQTLMCGPLVYYNDYIQFITGENFEKHLSTSVDRPRPSPTKPVLQKLSTSVFYLYATKCIATYVPHSYMVSEKMLLHSSFWHYSIYALFSTTAARFKYYFAWKWGETICNASGLGFDGYRENGEQNWDLVSVLNIWRVETSTNFKILLDNWNVSTHIWLKRCAYERAPRSIRTLATFVLSAIWHGFYPGYYCCFVTGACVTSAARNGRRYIRPYFQSNATLQMIYDVITITITRFALAYTVAPFVLLSLADSWKFYCKTYFAFHVLWAISMTLPYIMKNPERKDSTAIQSGGDHAKKSIAATN